ncbi:MAG: hypothetical protein SFY69_07440 [Planctomycetota bacterium]|nr:hypothetical protein [Planctomycetota bacterium]
MRTSAALSLALAAGAAAQTITCQPDGHGNDVVVELWDSPRPLALPGGGYTDRVAAEFLSLNVDPEGDLPKEVAITPDGRTALVVHMGTLPLSGGLLSFVDIATQTTTGSVPLGQLPVQVAVSPDGRYAVTPNVFSNDVTIVDLTTRTVAFTVPVTGTQPFRAEITSDSRFAIVAVTNNATTTAFAVIDLMTGVEVRSIPAGSQGAIGAWGTPEFGMSGPLHSKFTLTPDGTRILLPVSTTAAPRFAVYDVATGVELASIPVAASPRSVDVSADGTRAVVGHEGSAQRVSVIDLTTNTLLASHPTGVNLSEQVIRLTPDNSHAIAAISNNVIFVDLASGVVDATIMTGSVGDIEIVDSTTAFVSNFNSRVIDISSRTLVATLPLAACVETAVTRGISPARAVTVNSRFREDVHFYTITGATSTADGFIRSGPLPEADATKPLAISPDGATLVAGNPVSRNVSIIDTGSRTVRATIDTGDRIGGVAVTPDGQTAVAVNSDSNTVSIIDLNTDAVVATLPVVTRPWHVKISPDGSTAAVLTVAGTDAIVFIDLNGAASSIIGSTIAGQTGSAQGYAYTDVSGIEFSPDGATLAVCRSFDDLIRLIDVGTRAVIADVPVGDFPMRITFTPDGAKAFVTNAFSDSVQVLAMNGAASSVVATIAGIDFPFTTVIDAAGQYAYVNNVGTSPRISIFDVAANALLTSLTLSGGNPRDMVLTPDGTLLVAGADTTGGKLYVVNAAGASSSVEEIVPLAASPFMIVHAGDIAAISQPVPDGVDLVDFGAPCDPDVNQDGNVDQDDIACLAQAVAGSPECLGGGVDPDFNRDGNVDQDDISSLEQVVAGAECP